MKLSASISRPALAIILTLLGVANLTAQPASPRERLSMDFDWRFAFGHATDPSKDFDPAPASETFSYFAKAGYARGAALPAFDDSGWRRLNLPHDWAVEAPFDQRGSGSHGYKAIGKNFPESSVGWYRKTFTIPASDLGRHITIQFDGVFRDSKVWINGFYLGNEPSGYTSFTYDLTDYLNYGGDNTVAVRVDASLEEGWFYEGAGIYRHVWLTKTAPVHVGQWGTFVTTEVTKNSATVTARVTVENSGSNNAAFSIEQNIQSQDGKPAAKAQLKDLALKPGASGDYSSVLKVAKPDLWSPETPTLYTLVTLIRQDTNIVDRYETPFGIRTVRFDANQGFFLNGQRVELKGTCDHQDAGGVGVAVPDELNAFRVAQLKKMGSNAIRTSHNPPTPELLEACDRLGMMVMDETRAEGTTPQIRGELERLMKRDRNHPCVVIWSLGNEEWSLEGNEKGTRVTQNFQDFARLIDPTRRFTLADSGGWGKGTSISIDVMGFNYFGHGNTDQYHTNFPTKPSVGSEEGSTTTTRAVYFEDRDHQHLTAYDTNAPDWATTAENAWQHFAPRPYLAGLFIWTGFDYRGEETPFGWPAINSQFGILDMCGFPKDNFYYYQAAWSDKPMVHLLPHWNLAGHEDQEIEVWAYSNCEEVELFLDGQSLGRQTIKPDSHLAWKVKYAPGTLSARAFLKGQQVATDVVTTAGAPAEVQLLPHRQTLDADGQDVSIITVQVFDDHGRRVPNATNAINFTLSGPGKIIGVGNGDPSSHEPDVFVEKVSPLTISNWRQLAVTNAADRPEVAPAFDDSNWQPAFAGRGGGGGRGELAIPGTNKVFGVGRGGRGGGAPTQPTVYRASFDLPENASRSKVTLSVRRLGQQQLYVNGRRLAETPAAGNGSQAMELDSTQLVSGKNVLALVVTPTAGAGGRRDGGGGGGAPISGQLITPPGDWRRSLFGGFAQVIVQTARQSGTITLTASASGLAPAVVKLIAQSADRPVVAGR